MVSNPQMTGFKLTVERVSGFSSVNEADTFWLGVQSRAKGYGQVNAAGALSEIVFRPKSSAKQGSSELFVVGKGRAVNAALIDKANPTIRDFSRLYQYS